MLSGCRELLSQPQGRPQLPDTGAGAPPATPPAPWREEGTWPFPSSSLSASGSCGHLPSHTASPHASPRPPYFLRWLRRSRAAPLAAPAGLVPASHRPPLPQTLSLSLETAAPAEAAGVPPPQGLSFELLVVTIPLFPSVPLALEVGATSCSCRPHNTLEGSSSAASDPVTNFPPSSPFFVLNSI